MHTLPVRDAHEVCRTVELNQRSPLLALVNYWRRRGALSERQMIGEGRRFNRRYERMQIVSLSIEAAVVEHPDLR